MGSEKRERKKHNQAARRAALEAARKKAERRKRLRRTAVLAAALVFGVVGVTYLATRGGDDGTDVATGGSTTSTTSELAVPRGRSVTGDTPCPKEDGTEERATSFAKPPPMCIDPAKAYTAVVKTDAGDITLALDAAKAPKTVNNFVTLARYRFYDGIAFHRVVKDFVIQGGDPQGTGSGGPGYEFADELPQPGDYAEGSVAMANSGPNTNGSQFFIVTSPAGAQTLVQAVGGAAKYSLFAKVTAGLDVVKAIEADGPEVDGGPAAKFHKITSVTISQAG